MPVNRADADVECGVGDLGQTLDVSFDVFLAMSPGASSAGISGSGASPLPIPIVPPMWCAAQIASAAEGGHISGHRVATC
jgi:hypothetical protein